MGVNPTSRRVGDAAGERGGERLSAGRRGHGMYVGSRDTKNPSVALFRCSFIRSVPRGGAWLRGLY